MIILAILAKRGILRDGEVISYSIGLEQGRYLIQLKLWWLVPQERWPKGKVDAC